MARLLPGQLEPAEPCGANTTPWTLPITTFPDTDMEL